MHGFISSRTQFARRECGEHRACGGGAHTSVAQRQCRRAVRQPPRTEHTHVFVLESPLRKRGLGCVSGMPAQSWCGRGWAPRRARMPPVHTCCVSATGSPPRRLGCTRPVALSKPEQGARLGDARHRPHSRFQRKLRQGPAQGALVACRVFAPRRRIFTQRCGAHATPILAHAQGLCRWGLHSPAAAKCCR